MNFQEIASQSLESVLAHKVRSILTLLGVVFGVAAVIAMLSIGEGARQETLEQISVMGVHNVIIHASDPGKDAEKDDNDKVTNSLGLTLKDARAIEQECSFAEKVEANVEHKKAAFYGGEHSDVPVIGVTPAYADIYNTKLKEGRFITQLDNADIANHCVIGWGVKQKLFAFKNALGERVKLGAEWFTVVGVVEPKLQLAKFSGPNNRDLNMDVYIPVTTALSKFGREQDQKSGNRFVFNGQSFGDEQTPHAEVDQITVKLSEAVDAGGAASVINRILSRRHNNAKDFTITVPEELLRQKQETQRIFNIVMIAIAGISLLVGGIGIMNIMLASVLERTREIGVRRALGATQRTVVTQFLLEAVILSVSGGLFGLAVGYGMTSMISAYAQWRTIVSPESVIAAFGVSVATGVLFGYYPAREAALKNPIDALRYE